ncbi:terminase small subunit [Sporosarcina sp. UB5]|uniref:terminase small subunit n=1 Tax=Sporosarcina sp. UB5 TaxID=3047463 RepID=UPI003D7B7B81
MPNWEEIQREWETTKITFKALAEKHGVKEGTLKSRRSREGWVRGAPKKDATKPKKVATIKKDATVFEPVVESDELTDKQRLFCIYYIKSFNATMAAIKAGYSRHSAHVEGSRLLRNAKVADEIRRLKGEMQQGIFIDAIDVLNMYIQIAFADMRDFVDFGSIEKTATNPETGKPLLDENFKPIKYRESYVYFKNADEVDGSLITEISNGRNGPVIKLASKEKALDILSKHFDMVPDHFKRQLETEKLKIAHAKAFGVDEQEEYEDDGFHQALNATTSEVWGNVSTDTDEG